MNILLNGHLKQFNIDHMTVATLVQKLELTGKRIAIECNGNIVPRSQFELVKLVEGDKLEIVGAVGGG